MPVTDYPNGLHEARIMFSRMWTQGIIANYSSANVNGAHQIIGVTENQDGTMTVVMESRYGLSVISLDGRPYRNQKVKITVNVEVIDISRLP